MRQHIIPFATASGALIVSLSVWLIASTDVRFPTFDVQLPSFDSRTAGQLGSETDSQTDVNEDDELAGVGSGMPDSQTARQPNTPAQDLETSRPRDLETSRATQAVGFPAQMAAGQTALGNGDLARAETAFTAAAQLEPRNVRALLALADVQSQLGQTKKATANLAAAEKIMPGDIQIARMRGRVALRAQDFSAADTAFTSAGAAARYERGLLASFFDRQDEARELLRAVSTSGIEPQATSANRVLAAYDQFALFPDSTKAHLDTLLAHAYNKAGEYELAEAKLTPVITDAVEFRDAWLLLGYAQLALKNYTDATSSFETAYRLDPAKPETSYFLGTAYAGQQDFVKSAAAYERAAANGFAPQRDVLSRLADVYYQAGLFEKAAPLYEQLLTSTSDVEAFVRPVYLYLDKLENGTAAWTVASQALRAYPRDAMAYNLAGWVSVENGYLAEAKRYLDRAIQLDPALPSPYLNLGRYFEAAGDIESAKAMFKKAYDLDTAGSVGAQAAVAFNALR